MSRLQYKFYATLLDTFEGYKNSSRLYQKFWGFSENPKKTEEEFEKEQFQNLIDTINRVPFDSEAADKGTAFNEVVDCLILNKKSDKMDIKSDTDKNIIIATYNERTFIFPIPLCKEFANYFKGAVPQEKVSGVLETKYGDVELYGYLDELMPFKISDIKTTKRYNAFKYRDNWQHLVYPFCVNQQGADITEFEYVITDFKKIYKEVYNYNPDRDVPRLVNQCEELIEFIEANRGLITDEKIFAFRNVESVA